MRVHTRFEDLKPGTRFYPGPRTKKAFRKLPDTIRMSRYGHGLLEPETIFQWASDDLTKFFTHSLWAHEPFIDGVWIDEEETE